MFRINQYNVTIVSQSRGKSQLVSELGPDQPQLVFTQISVKSHSNLRQMPGKSLANLTRISGESGAILRLILGKPREKFRQI